MKLSELVALRTSITRAFNPAPITTGLDVLDTDLCNVKNSTDDIEIKNEISSLTTNLHEIYNSLKLSQDQFNNIVGVINQRILDSSKHFFTENYEIELSYNDVENSRAVRVMPLSEELRNRVAYRIQFYTDWKYPALEIGCRDGEWTEYLVAADPLYLVDFYREFTESAVKNFTEEYRRRVRVYLAKDHNLTVLPANQFGFIFSWNHINYLSLDTVKQYLKTTYNLLRPGGTFMFSYNNGDTQFGAAYAESYFMSYIPKSMLLPLCESIGFKITHTEDILDTLGVSWVEIQKPGVLSTVKAHQVLGELRPITY